MRTLDKTKIESFKGTKRQMLTAVRFIRKEGPNQVWEFKCDCGNTKQKRKGNFLKATTNNCGCRYGKKTHGLSMIGRQDYSHRHPIYSSWVNMRQRCNNPSNPNYIHYGGRGIKVCQRWNSFSNFLNDMGMPEKGMTIERIDVNGNYEPSNCKWATRKQQSRNTRVTNMLTYKGVAKPLAVWAEEYGQTFSDLYRHAVTYKWDVERSLHWKRTP